MPGRVVARLAAAVAAAALAACGGRAGDAATTGFGPAARPAPPRTAAPRPAVALLLYHHLADPPPGDAHTSLWVSPQRFAQQIHALAAAGFHAVTLAQVDRAWRGGALLPRRPVVVTFDDGYPEQDTVGRRVLRRRRWPAVLNLQLNRLDGPGGLDRAAIRRMVRDGWEIDDHSATHPDLTRVDAARLRAEVAGSRAALRLALGVDPRFFCYPYGRVDGRVRAAVEAAGFIGATTTRPARATALDDPFLLPRIVVRRTTTPAQLVRIAAGRSTTG
jgi:peptidoglycan/xylan/chitin deacetylase (PgdA/CDA1 family)